MTLEQKIKQLQETIQVDKNLDGYVRPDHQQELEWLQELKEYREKDSRRE